MDAQFALRLPQTGTEAIVTCRVHIAPDSLAPFVRIGGITVSTVEAALVLLSFPSPPETN